MKHFSFCVPQELQGVRLDQGLYQLMQPHLPLSKSAIRKLVVAGAVYLNQSRVRIASKPLRAGARLELYYDENKARQLSGFRKYVITQVDILYEDEWLLAVNKPSGLPMAATLDEARYNLVTAVQEFLNKKTGTPAYLGIHHRLDADTSGVVLFTKSKEANPAIARLFQEHLISKNYHALCNIKTSELKEEWAIRNQLLRIHPKKNKYRVAREGEEGSFAYTQCRLLERREMWALVEARPVTGRTHQIRVQLSAMGLPILGDVIYGSRDAPRLMLHAKSVKFQHPFTMSELVIEAPTDAVWQDVLAEKLTGGI